MTTTDRLALLVLGVLVALLVLGAVVYAAHELSAALEGLAL